MYRPGCMLHRGCNPQLQIQSYRARNPTAYFSPSPTLSFSFSPYLSLSLPTSVSLKRCRFVQRAVSSTFTTKAQRFADSGSSSFLHSSFAIHWRTSRFASSFQASRCFNKNITKMLEESWRFVSICWEYDGWIIWALSSIGWNTVLWKLSNILLLLFLLLLLPFFNVTSTMLLAVSR